MSTDTQTPGSSLLVATRPRSSNFGQPPSPQIEGGQSFRRRRASSLACLGCDHTYGVASVVPFSPSALPLSSNCSAATVWLVVVVASESTVWDQPSVGWLRPAQVCGMTHKEGTREGTRERRRKKEKRKCKKKRKYPTQGGRDEGSKAQLSKRRQATQHNDGS